MTKFVVAFVIAALGFGSVGCTFVAGPASGSLKYNGVKRSLDPIQVPAERQTHRKMGKHPKPRPHDN